MARIIAIFFVFLCLSFSALAEPDLSSLSFDELSALRNQIMVEMMTREEWRAFNNLLDRVFDQRAQK